MSQGSTSFLGRAGQLFVMAELLERGWNVGLPEVDVGHGVLAARTGNADLTRVQVKTGRATERTYGYSSQFNVDPEQLRTVRQPVSTYVFVVRIGATWGPMVVVDKPKLRELAVEEGMGSEQGTIRTFYVRYHLGDEEEVQKVLCSDSELTDYVGDLSRWEQIER